MATLTRISAEDLRKARKAGFKKKAPKKPKGKASLSVLENFVSRYNSWVKDAKDAISNGKRREDLKKQISNL